MAKKKKKKDKVEYIAEGDCADCDVHQFEICDFHAGFDEGFQAAILTVEDLVTKAQEKFGR